MITDSKKAEWGQVDFSDCMNLEIRKIYADVSRNVNYLFIYLFIYKLRQKAWITHRASSTTRFGKREKKISNTTNKNDNTLETTKKKRKCKTRIGEDIDKK